MADDIILNEQERLDFWSFVQAPHAKPELQITHLYIAAGRSLLNDHPAKIAEFLADAHSRGLQVDYLTGDPLWALKVEDRNGVPYNQPSFDELSDLLNYNATVHAYQRFDGYQQDTEPYILGGKNRNDPLSWQEDMEEIWAQYIEGMTTWKSMIDKHNTYTGDDLVMGASIPPWWDPAAETSVSHETVQDIVDYIAIMNYNTRPPVAAGIESEVNYATAQGYAASVYAGMECMELNFKEQLEESVFKSLYIHSSSYFSGDGNGLYGIEFLQQDTALLEQAFADNSAYIGSAYHYYEDIKNGDSALRSLNKTAYNHAPTAWVISPSYTEVLSGMETIRYVAYDPDGDALNILIEYSDDAGLNWTAIADFILTEQTNKRMCRTETWDTTALAFGDHYKIRITVTEETGDLLNGFDQSDFNFSLVAQKADFVAPDPVHALSIRSSYGQPGEINVWWDPAVDDYGVAGYLYAFAPITQPADAYFSRGNYIRIDAPKVDSMLYVRAIDFSGQLSTQTAYAITAVDDLNQNGIPKAYESVNENLDLDGDGVADVDEIAEGTHPEDPLDFSPTRVIGYWPMEHNLYNAIAGGPELIEEVSSGGATQYGMGIRDHRHAMELQGTMPVRLLLNDAAVPFGTGTRALTIEMWIKPDPMSQNSLPFIPLASFGDIDGGLTLLLKNDGDLLSLRKYSEKADGSYTAINANNDNLFDGEWHHIACTFDGYNGYIRLYINGRLVSQKRNPSLATLIPNSRVLRFFDGRSNYDTDNNIPASDPVNVNTGQFENNRFNFFATDVRYLGWVDNIKVTKAAVPIQKLSYYQDQSNNYQEWQSTAFSQFQSKTPDLSDPEADSSGDGISNLMSFAAGLDPRDNNSGSFVEKTVIEMIGGQRHLSRYFLQSKTASVDVRLESSLDCVQWSDVSDAVPSLEGETPESWLKKISIPLDAKRLFLRLTVTE